MAKTENQSPLRSEQQKLSRPLGLRRPLSWVIGLPILLAFLVLPWLASSHPEWFGENPIEPSSQASVQSTMQPPMQATAAPNNAHPGFYNAPLGHVSTFMSLDSVWNPGPVASAHQAWEGDCKVCHAGNFSRVQDESCESCHGNMGEHLNPAEVAETTYEEPRCATCHRDHKGLESLAEQNKHFVGSDCAECHQNIQARAPQTLTLPVKGFEGADHPEFRVTLRETANATLTRVRMKEDLVLSEPTTLKFPHDVHLDPEGIEGKGQIEVMQCQDCHEPADTQTGFKPLEMENHCQDCHSLAFEPAMPGREVPHGPSGPILDTLVEFYSFLAQNPNLQAQVKAERATLLARPGNEDEPRISVNAKPLDQAQAAAKDLFENRACAVCHEVTVSTEPVAYQSPGAQLTAYTVADIGEPHPWMPMARFDHEAHAFDSCSTCHSAEQSENAEEVLMPALATCQSCHSDAQSAALDKVPSNCGVCHGYHIHDQPPQNPEETAPVGLTVFKQ